jgi:ABC-2 type transport system ATP-binding protein
VLAEAVSRGSVTSFTRRRPTLSEIFQEVVQ